MHFDFITRDANDAESDVLYSLSTVCHNVSYPLKEEPLHLEFHPVNTSAVNSVRIWIMDVQNAILNLNGLAVALSLMITLSSAIPDSASLHPT